MDLIKAIGEDQGFDVEFENLSFDGLIPALKAGRYRHRGSRNEQG